MPFARPEGDPGEDGCQGCDGPETQEILNQSHAERRACGQLAVRSAAARDGEADDDGRSDEHECQPHAAQHPRWGWAIFRWWQMQDADASENHHDTERREHKTEEDSPQRGQLRL